MGAKKTPLYTRHLDLGGKMVAFAGFMMPVEYTGIVEEHLSVRNCLGVFDVSHMGEIVVCGDRAAEYLNRVTTNDLSRISPCQGQYTAMLNERAGVIDDLIIYRRQNDYLLVVNAANADRDFAWLTSRAPKDVSVVNLSDRTGQIALQGPEAERVMSQICPGVSGLGYFYSTETHIGEFECLVSRTGYTGEDGFEIYLAAENTAAVWDMLMDAFPRPRPCGLGARDTLRLEMGYRLHGSDMDESTTPLEAGLGWIVKPDKGDFIGKETLLDQMKQGVPKRLIGLKSEAKRFPRRGCSVLVDGETVGEVTSGGFSPSLQCGVALAYVKPAFAKADSGFKIEVRGHLIDAKYEKGSFYKKASHK